VAHSRFFCPDPHSRRRVFAGEEIEGEVEEEVGYAVEAGYFGAVAFEQEGYFAWLLEAGSCPCSYAAEEGCSLY